MHIAKNFRQFIIMLVVMSFSSQVAMGKRPTPMKLIKQEPIIDTSIFVKPSRFEIGIKHTDILSPPDPAILLKERLRDMRLRDLRLRELRIRDMRLRELRARTDKSDSALRGSVAEDNRRSIIETLEYGVKPQFYADLFKLMPETAPDLTSQMEAQLSESKVRLTAQVAQAEKLMKLQLSARQPQRPLVPLVPHSDVTPELSSQLKQQLARAEKQPRVQPAPTVGSTSGAVELSKQIKLQLARSQEAERAQIERGNQQLQLALASARQNAPRVPTPTGMPPNGHPLQFPNSGVVASLNRPTDDAQKQMQEQLVAAKFKRPPEADIAAHLVAAKLQSPAETEVAARLMQAKKKNDAIAAQTKPQMDAIVTALRLPPAIDNPTIPNRATAVEAVADAVIPWDLWHANFAKLARTPLLNAISKSTNPSGANTVSITVRPDHHLVVSLTRKSNPAFDEAVLNAYRSLDGNGALEYPAGSRRKTVTFLIDNKHGASGTPSGVKSQTSVGDKEHTRR